MVDTLGWANAVSGAPTYSGRQLRQLNDVNLSGASTARPLGVQSGVRPGTPTTTVTATSTTWSCGPFAGVADVMVAAESGGYPFAFDATTSGAVNAADATNPRCDIIYVKVTDPEDSVTAPKVERLYLAGTPGALAPVPATPAGGFAIANINVPKVGGGSPTVSWIAPYTVGAGGILPVLTKAALPATSYKGSYAEVTADPSTANNGLYKFNGTAWVLVVGDSGWIAATLQNSWAYFGSPYSTAAYRRLNGVVYLRGTVKNGSITTGTAVFTLPAGYRPTSQLLFGVQNNSAFGTMNVLASGVIGCATIASNASLSLDTISFPADA